jgi:hypothetical protein
MENYQLLLKTLEKQTNRYIMGIYKVNDNENYIFLTEVS